MCWVKLWENGIDKACSKDNREHKKRCKKAAMTLTFDSVIVIESKVKQLKSPTSYAQEGKVIKIECEWLQLIWASDLKCTLVHFSAEPEGGKKKNL